MNINNFAKKLFSVSICLSLILNTYSIEALPLGTLLNVIASIFCIISIFRNNGKIRIYTPIFIMAIVTIVITLIQITFSNSTIINTTDLFHYIFYCLYISMFSKSFFEFDYGYHVYKLIAIVSAIYAYLQYIVFILFGFYLSGHILPFSSGIINHYEGVTNTYFLRVYSLFSEPAAFGLYVALFLAIDLLLVDSCNKNFKKSIIINLILSFSVFLSRTTTGISLCLLIWIIWIYRYKSRLFKNKKRLIVFILLLFCIFGYVANSESTAVFIQHTFGNSNTNTKTGTEGRTSGYSYIEELKVPMYGNGMSMEKLNPYIYITDYGLLYYYFGLFGILAYLLIFIYIALKKRNSSVYVLFIQIIANVFANYIFGIAPSIFYPWIISYREKDE